MQSSVKRKGSPATAPQGWAAGSSPGGLGALQRLLAQWGVPCAPVATGRLNEHFSAWLDWRDAVALSQALSQAPSPPPHGATAEALPRKAASDLAADGAALTRMRDQLIAGFADNTLVRGGDEGIPGTSLADTSAAFRVHHSAQQRAMAARIATLRERLRLRLREASAQGAQLAALDEVFEQALAGHEQQLLSALPSMLMRRAAVLRAADRDAPTGTSSAAPNQSALSGWRAQLWDELQRALHAELDLRLQPVLGLLETLTHTSALPAP